MTKPEIKCRTLPELKAELQDMGEKPFRAGQIFQWLHQGVQSFDEMTNISKPLRAKLAEHYLLTAPKILRKQVSQVDGTIKYLYQTADGHYIETVYIPDGDRATLCVSSQVGCRMGCKFCMTGRQGFHGNLTATDILNQLYSLPERDTLTNVVFLGQGEPLDNIDHVLRATELLTASYGYAWSPKRITVSTVGVRKGLLRFLEESDCHLAVSLHNPFPEQRHKMMPAENGYSLTEFMPLLRRQDWTHQRRVSFEYIVFGGLNDTPAHARELVSLLAPFECRVNLIRFHDIPDTEFRGAPEQTMTWLRDYLTQHGVTTTIRASRGQDIFAACGLLSTAKQEEEVQ